MFPAILSICLAISTAGITSVHALALDRLPSSFSIRSGPDLLIRFPFTLERNQSLTRRTPFPYSFHNATSTTFPQHNSKLKRTPTPTDDAPNDTPTPAPTGDPSNLTTVHISDEQDFALLLPKTPNGSFLPRNLFLVSLSSCPFELANCFYFF
jgi:hypothetical protein